MAKQKRKNMRKGPSCQHDRRRIGESWDLYQTGEVRLHWRCKRCGKLGSTVVDNRGTMAQQSYTPGVTRTSTGHVVGGNPDPRGPFVWMPKDREPLTKVWK